MLLPLAVFLCLSCPIKHEIKQVLNIATTAELDLEKNNHIRPCTAAFSKEDLAQNNELRADIKSLATKEEVVFSISAPLSNGHSSDNFQYEEAIFPIPLFIYHRKLII